MTEEFRRQIAVVTGGSRGIGKAVTLALAAAGATVIVGFHADEASARATCQQANGACGEALPQRVDITDSDQVRDFFERIHRSAGPPDILVNCAGLWPTAKAWEISDTHWRQTIAVNLDGTYYACREACLAMIPRRRGSIVNLSSVSAARGAHSGHADYSAAKGGVESLTKSLARELGEYGITVNAVAPGMIRTDMTAEALRARESEYIAQIPLGRIGTPEDIAAAILFLASPRARYITGQVLHVNGGLVMP